ncbi:MAG: aminopeptidase P N-terminal domain-containing protein [Salibacteraceae bacterium]
MRYLPIDASLYVANRKQFVQHLKPQSLAVFNSNDIMPSNADGTMPFRQNSDLLHLSGVDQEESILVLFPDAKDAKHREVLFLKETSELIAIWEGAKLTKTQATEVSGIESVHWLKDFDSVFKAMMAEAENVYINSNEHLRAKIVVETRDARFIKKLKADYPGHSYQRSAPIMHQIRAIKSPIEIDLMQTACNITEKGFRRVLEFVKPGVMEFEIQAEFMHEFLRNRSRGFSYEPIVASGFNACVLHYVENNAECKDGDLLLMDVGAEYANYASDMTRAIPVNGRYTDRQKSVYNAVLQVMREASQLLRPGTMLGEYHQEVGKMMESELKGLGLITQHDIDNQDPSWPAYKKYFMHGTSHYLGLDVHDVGLWNTPMEAGMVFTCEPGIYIREESLGIRIENDFVVTDGAPNDLMGNIPIEVEEIEDLMNQ